MDVKRRVISADMFTYLVNVHHMQVLREQPLKNMFGNARPGIMLWCWKRFPTPPKPVLCARFHGPVVDVAEGARLKQAKQVGNFAHAVTECLSVISVVV